MVVALQCPRHVYIYRWTALNELYSLSNYLIMLRLRKQMKSGILPKDRKHQQGSNTRSSTASPALLYYTHTCSQFSRFGTPV